jgi:hypothetical protein
MPYQYHCQQWPNKTTDLLKYMFKTESNLFTQSLPTVRIQYPEQSEVSHIKKAYL